MPILRIFSVYKTTMFELPKMKFASTLILSGFQSYFSTQNLGDHSLANIYGLEFRYIESNIITYEYFNKSTFMVIDLMEGIEMP